MLMRLPASGSWIESLLTNLGGPTAGTGDGTAVRAVSEAQFADAFEAMVRGDIEFIILEDGEAFLQAAGVDDGPYALEFQPGGGAEQLEVAGGVDAATARARLAAYLRGDAGWRDSLEWTPLRL